MLTDDYLFWASIHSYGEWCLYAFRLFVMYTVFSFALFFCLDGATRSYTMKFKSIVIKKK